MNSDKTVTIAFLYKIFNKSIYMDDNRCFSWYQSFGLGRFHQPDSVHRNDIGSSYVSKFFSAMMDGLSCVQ